MRHTLARILRRMADWISPPDDEIDAIRYSYRLDGIEMPEGTEIDEVEIVPGQAIQMQGDRIIRRNANHET